MNKHQKEIEKFVQEGDYVETESGFLIHGSIIAEGKYVHTVNGEDEREDFNLIPTAGINYLLDVGLSNGTKIGSWYLGLYTSNVAPTAAWTPTEFVTTGTESTSTTEGYTEVSRPAWTDAGPSAGAVNNYASRADFTIATASTFTVWGAAMLSVNTRGSQTGTLVSAVQFGSARVLNDADVFQLGYQVTLTDS